MFIVDIKGRIVCVFDRVYFYFYLLIFRRINCLENYFIFFRFIIIWGKIVCIYEEEKENKLNGLNRICFWYK